MGVGIRNKGDVSGGGNSSDCGDGGGGGGVVSGSNWGEHT